MTAKNYGALPGEWTHFADTLGLLPDLLPVVGNPAAIISPKSKMAATGKTPSVYNHLGQVTGVSQWTGHVASPRDIKRWDQESDYGICIQTRHLRAIDVDITDEGVAREILNILGNTLGDAPRRVRENASKFLVPLRISGDGDYQKRVIRAQHGIIEFLATGQQFVACGTHPSGVRYEWLEGSARELPTEFPEITPDMFEALWAELARQFAVEPLTSAKSSQPRAQKLADAISYDDTAKRLIELNLVLSSERDGRMHIVCPFEAEHTGESSESSTSYFPANTGGYALGHFKCLHAHCEHRTDDDFRGAIGMPNIYDDFAALDSPGGVDEKHSKEARRFQPIGAFDFATGGQKTEWLVKGVLPKAELAMVYGPPASGKTFWVLDLVSHIVQGLPWNGRKVAQGGCLYIAAEGANGVRKRLEAYQTYHGIDIAEAFSNLHFIADAPRLTEKQDRRDLAQAIKTLPVMDLIVVDTLASVMPGADENSGKEMGEVLAYCKALHKHFGALVLLVHHSGKDATKGARGWSGLLGAVDCEIQIARFGDDRAATITKLKDGDDTEQSYGFKLNTVELGQDEDGDPITSCVVLQSNSAGRAKPVVKNAIERILLDTLEDLKLFGDRIAVNDLIEATIDKLPFEEKNDRRRANTMKALENAAADQRVRIHEGWVE